MGDEQGDPDVGYDYDQLASALEAGELDGDDDDGLDDDDMGGDDSDDEGGGEQWGARGRGVRGNAAAAMRGSSSSSRSIWRTSSRVAQLQPVQPASANPLWAGGRCRRLPRG